MEKVCVYLIVSHQNQKNLQILNFGPIVSLLWKGPGKNLNDCTIFLIYFFWFLVWHESIQSLNI